jgi:DNA-binding transcriptional MocR family regulator
MESPARLKFSGDRLGSPAWMGVDAPAERVVVCAGAQHAYTVAASTLLSPGDAAIAEALTSPLLIQLSHLLQLRLHGAAIDEHGLIPEALDDLCRSVKPRVLFCTPNLHDPTGAVLPEERRRQIAEIAKRHDLAIVEDDRFGFLVDSRPPPICAFAPERTLYFTCTSKCLERFTV